VAGEIVITIGKLVRAALIALISTAAAAAAQAKDFPSRLITLIVPFPAGGPSDALARAIAQRMATDLRQSIVVENVGGASGTIGLARFTKSPPDGHTLAFGTVGTHVANVALFKALPYDPRTDFEPIGLAGTAPIILIAKSSLPVSSLEQFVTHARIHGAALKFGSAGIGSISHFSCVTLLGALDLNPTHVPYRGVAPAMNDLVGGHIDFMCDQTTTALPQVTAGSLKAIATLTKERIAQLADVRTATEAGYADVDIRAWNALFAPRGTPSAVVQRLAAALRAALDDPGLQTQLKAVGVDLPDAQSGSAAAVARLIDKGIAQDVPALRRRGESLE
jgi:tripartite-type tricarboxylate transporter receptor subunit TctC